MSDTQADIGYGITVEVADPATPAVKILLGEIKSVSLPSDTTDQHDATNMQSKNKTREFVSGLTDAGEFGFEMNYVPGSLSDKTLTAIKGKKRLWYVTFPSGNVLIFSGTRQSYEKTAPLDDIKTASVSVKVSGEPALTDVAAPRNLVLPTITGLPKVGVPLELDWGVFAGAYKYDIQWQADGTNIVGATGSTFVPKAAQVGKVITAEVTAANDSFNLMAETAGTAVVAA